MFEFAEAAPIAAACRLHGVTLRVLLNMATTCRGIAIGTVYLRSDLTSGPVTIAAKVEVLNADVGKRPSLERLIENAAPILSELG